MNGRLKEYLSTVWSMLVIPPQDASGRRPTLYIHDGNRWLPVYEDSQPPQKQLRDCGCGSQTSSLVPTQGSSMVPQSPGVNLPATAPSLPYALPLDNPQTYPAPPPPVAVPQRIAIDAPPGVQSAPRPASPPKLSMLMERGRQYHPRAHKQWVEQRGNTYYTCALAAAYAGYFGPNSVFPGMAPDMIMYELSQVTKIDLRESRAKSDDGRFYKLGTAIIEMNDTGWSRAAIARWLRSNGC